MSGCQGGGVDADARAPWSTTTRRFRMNWPLAEAGLARRMASERARAFSRRAVSSKETLPIGAWALLPDLLSARNSTRPALASFDRLRDLARDRPGLWIGHHSTGAEDPAQPPHLAHHVGRSDDQVEIEPATSGSSRSDRPASHMIGAGFLGLSGNKLALGDDHHAHLLARPVWQHHLCRGWPAPPGARLCRGGSRAPRSRRSLALREGLQTGSRPVSRERRPRPCRTSRRLPGTCGFFLPM